MHGHQRSERMAAQLQRLLAVLIRDEVRDPGAAGATVTATQVSRDLSSAKIYILAADPESSRRAAEALNRASGFLRTRIASEIIARRVPTLRFLYDATVDDANRMEDLIARARARDDEGGDEENGGEKDPQASGPEDHNGESS